MYSGIYYHGYWYIVFAVNIVAENENFRNATSSILNVNVIFNHLWIPR